MKNIVGKYWQSLLTLTFGIGVFIFWYILYPYALSFQEELQLFIYDSQYLIERLGYSGGVSVYIAEFLTQFYTSLTAGAIILAVIFVILQQLTWKVAKNEGADDRHYPLSFVPAVFLLYSMGDENILLGLVVATIIALSVNLLYTKIETNRWKIAAIAIGLPILFWIASSAAYITVGYIIIREIRKNGINKESILLSIGLIIYMIAIIIVCYRMSPYQFYRVASGINFYRYRHIVSKAEIAILLIFTITPAIAGFITKWQNEKCVSASKNNSKTKGNNWITRTETLEAIAIAICCIFVVRTGYDERKYDIMEYDMLLRRHSWDKIIEKAEKKQATSPTEVSTINFALAMEGRMTDRMFEFYQKNSEGLMPLYKRELTSTLMANEIYFRIGMINTAQRFAFESLESIPNHQKSGRIMRRLVETNMINGQYEVAEKYIKILKKTFAYRRWANEMEGYLYNDEKIDKHPFYGEMRRFRVTEDFLYSDNEMDQMLGLLFMHNNDNRMALEYLLACELLTKDIGHFMEYYPLTSNLKGYPTVPPRSFQEAMIYAWINQGKKIQDCPWPVSDFVKQNMAKFGQIYMADKNSQQLQEGYFATSYWNYLFFER